MSMTGCVIKHGIVAAFYRVRQTCHGGDVPQTVSGTIHHFLLDVEFLKTSGNGISKGLTRNVPELKSNGSVSFSVPDFPRPGLELPVRVPLRAGGRHEVPGEETEGQ